MAMAQPVEPAFKSIPKNSTFFLVWRIEQLQVVPVPDEYYGHFYTGDSYIVACATEGNEKADSQNKPREVRGPLTIHIHFWLGSNTSSDEAGVAAYKTVELDDYLGGAPVQHREVQGLLKQKRNSKKYFIFFLQDTNQNGLFPIFATEYGFRVYSITIHAKGVIFICRLLEGGVASGLKHVDHVFKPALYQVKGKRVPTVKELQQINWDQFNDGDVFILDTEKYIFLWTGKNANNMEKIQGVKIAQQLKSEHGPDSNGVIIVDDGDENKELTHDEREIFENYLPLNDKSVKSSDQLPDDEIIEMKLRSELKLFRCSDDDGTLKVEEIKVGPLIQSDLDSNDSFIIDNNKFGIWVWIGKKASSRERVEAVRNAQGFIKKKGYPNHTPITRVIDGGEPIEFQSLFKTWKDAEQSTGFGQIYNVGKIAKIIPEKFDPTSLHENHVMAAETQLVDDGKGNKDVYRIKNFDLIKLDKNDYGKFYTGDCFIVVYTYGANVIIYYWLGLQSTIDERGTAAINTVKMDNEEFSGRAVQVRVVEGKEPPHFMTLFDGKMVIFRGGFSSGFNHRNDEEVENDSYLLEVRGTNMYNTKAIEVECKASSLNSNDVFILHTPAIIYIWAGKGSIGDEREMAKRISSEEKIKEIIFVSEGQEKDNFWDALGGKEDYSSDIRLQTADDPHTPRLFQCSNANGKFSIEEVAHFDQSDLVEEDVMILDAWDAVFIWIGDLSNAEERRLSQEAAVEYLNTDPSGRDKDTPILIVKQGFEPSHFTGFFGAWNNTLWKRRKSFLELKDELKHSKIQAVAMNRLQSMNGQSLDFDTIDKYSVDKLRDKDMVLLHCVDPSRKEMYLESTEFKDVFGMNYEEFQSLPRWKQIDLKKKVGLF